MGRSGSAGRSATPGSRTALPDSADGEAGAFDLPLLLGVGGREFVEGLRQDAQQVYRELAWLPWGMCSSLGVSLGCG